MKIGAIITEFNPLHNGHKYIINQIKEKYNIDCLITVMSGNFVQRGLPSILDKYTKTKIALHEGIDLVIELPVVYSISSAQNFAYGSISIINALSNLSKIDNLFFGIESNLSSLKQISNLCMSENFSKSLKCELKTGNISYAKSLEKAINSNIKTSNIIFKPNNILAIEYLNTLTKLNSNIEPIGITRNENFCSATNIRKYILNNNTNILKELLPKFSYLELMESIENKKYVPTLSCFEKEIFYAIYSKNIQQLENIARISEGLEYKIKKEIKNVKTIDELIYAIKSKRYPLTRINRIMLNILLEIEKPLYDFSTDTTPYIKILGLNDIGQSYLNSVFANINSNCIIDYSTKSLENKLKNKEQSLLLQKDILASNIYSLGYDNTEPLNDYLQKVIKV